MNVKILYFASLREAVGQASEELALPEGVASVGALRAHLAARGAGWDVLAGGRNVRAAVNQRMATADEVVQEGDEVAFFPPVTGG